MNRIQIYGILRRHVRLSEKRSPMLTESTVAKVLMVIGGCMMALYLVGLGVALGMGAAENDAYAMIMMALPVFLVIDFLVRFVVQQTPLMLMRPYMLLPMPRMTVIESFLLTSVSSIYNFLWLCLFLPYSYIIAMNGATVVEVVSVVIGGLLLVMANSQWYLMVRTLVSRSLLWWILPLAVYGGLILPFVLEDNQVGEAMGEVIETLTSTGLIILVALVLLGVLLWVNRWMQYRYVYEELAREQKKPAAMKHVARLTFLERFGLTGEYLKLEVKSIMRNKAIRTRVIMSLALIILFSVLITYTNMYDNRMMQNFWCYYCFAIYGMTTLVKIMGPEGNYIELLMSHRENILMLLRAKYWFHSIILVVPFLIMLPAVFEGKFSILMMLAYMLLSSGILYFLLFQLAAYNKQTLPLNQKITGKNNVESGFQLVVELVGMFAPLLLVALMLALFDENTAYLILAAIGLAFTLTYPIWLRNIYHRMMLRKYRNLEGFHATR